MNRRNFAHAHHGQLRLRSEHCEIFGDSSVNLFVTEFLVNRLNDRLESVLHMLVVLLEIVEFDRGHLLLPVVVPHHLLDVILGLVNPFK